MHPGTILEGHGLLLQHGRLMAQVDYHLTIPHETHFVLNPTGKMLFDYEEHLAGFIRVAIEDASNIELDQYALELTDKTKKTIRVERRYKQVEHKGRLYITYWVKVVSP